MLWSHGTSQVLLSQHFWHQPDPGKGLKPQIARSWSFDSGPVSSGNGAMLHDHPREGFEASAELPGIMPVCSEEGQENDSVARIPPEQDMARQGIDCPSSSGFERLEHSTAYVPLGRSAKAEADCGGCQAANLDLDTRSETAALEDRFPEGGELAPSRGYHLERDEQLARKLQEEENRRAGGQVLVLQQPSKAKKPPSSGPLERYFKRRKS